MRTLIAGAFALAGSLLVAPAASAVAPPADLVPESAWRVNANAEVIGYDTIQLTPTPTAEARVRTLSFGHAVTASSRITFDLAMRGNAFCQDGAPYMLGITDTGGTFSNFDDQTPCANNSTAPSWDSGTVAFPVNVSGTVDSLTFSAFTGGGGVYDISNVRVDGHLVLFAKRPMSAWLSGENLRSGADRVVVTTYPGYYAAGARVRVERVAPGPDPVVATGVLNKLGNARFTLADVRPNRERVFSVFVAGAEAHTFARTNRVTIQ